MSLYTSLRVSPRKKRVCSSSDEDSTPKRRKIATCPPTPRSACSLPTHLSRLNNLHSALQHALSHALATCAIAPSEQTGIIRNVLNHISIATYTGFTTKFDEDDLKRLCWIWEWDSAVPPPSVTTATDVDPNPFLVPTVPLSPKGWTRGSMGFIISPTSHYSKSAGKRVPVYGVGIELEMDIDKGMTGGMAAVARWTADADKRRAEFRSKLESWINHHPHPTQIPNIPLADLPQLAVHTAQPSSLTRALASASPKGAAILENMIPSHPSSPSKSPSKSSAPREFPVPFPTAKTRPSEPSPFKSSASHLHTPSSRLKRADPLAGLFTPKTPARKRVEAEGSDSLPTTPVHQRGSDAQTAPSTPSTSRRQALYDRVRLKSLTSTPAKAKSAEVAGGKLTREQIQKLGQEEIRRRCLLGRLGGVAECTWMLFSYPGGSTATPTTRRRKALRATVVAAAVVESSPVPISMSEAHESLKLLTTLCPFFLKPLDVNGEEWLEMPPTASASDITEISPKKHHETESPTKLSGAGGIRKVREIIRTELELHD